MRWREFYKIASCKKEWVTAKAIRQIDEFPPAGKVLLAANHLKSKRTLHALILRAVRCGVVFSADDILNLPKTASSKTVKLLILRSLDNLTEDEISLLVDRRFSLK